MAQARRTAMMCWLTCLLGVAYHASAFSPRGLQSSCVGHRCSSKRVGAGVPKMSDIQRERYMSTEEISLGDVSTETVFEDADGIGEAMNKEKPVSFDEFIETPLLLDENESVEVLASPEEIAEQIFAALPQESIRTDELMPDSTSSITVSGKQTEDDVIESPNLRQILRFAIPAIGVWLCSPILSLIDTGSVGLLSGTAQQAALNPAVAVTDYAALLAAFMYTATTNLVATAREKEKNCDDDKPLTMKTLITSMQLSGFVGGALGTCLIVFARILLRTIIGNDSIDPKVFTAAMKYVQIRALGMPAAVVIGSAQSASLGMQDIKSPLYVLLAAAIVNFVGDMVFVGSSHPWIGGAAGAAWATVFSQYAALAMFLKWFVSRRGNAKASAASETTEAINLTDAILELTGDCTAGARRRKRFRSSLKKFASSRRFKHQKTTKEASPSIRGFLHGRFRKRDLLKIPEKKAALEFWPYVVPVTTTSVGRVSSYIAMSHVVSSALGTISMAANQIILSLFYCLTPVADSLSLTAQSFVPAIFEKRRLRAGAEALAKTGKSFLKAGGLFGAAMVAAVACIPAFTNFFTADPTVIAQVNAAVPFLAGTFAVHGAICAGEGLLLGQKDLGFLGKSYGIFFAAVPFFMLRVKKAALAGLPGVNLSSVWEVFMGYQLVRVSLWVLRIKQLEKRTHSGVEGVGSV